MSTTPEEVPEPTARVRVRKRRPGLWQRLRRRIRHPVWWLTGLLALLLVLLAVDIGLRYVPAARSLAQGRDAALRAQRLLGGDLAHIDRARIDEATGLLAEAEQDFGDRSSIFETGWMARALNHLPLARTQMQAVRGLRATGVAAARLGLDLTPLLGDAVPRPESAAVSTVTRMALAAGNHQPEVAQAGLHLGELSAALRTVPDGWLAGPIDSARTIARRDGPRVTGAVGPAIGLLRAVPAAIGPGTHSYLLLLENPGEERPGGGFIGAVGEVTFVNGVLADSNFRDVTFSNSLVTNIPAPHALDAHLFRGHPLELSDANWSPDFPTSAAAVGDFYTRATGHKLDGVISVDPIALGYVLGVRGPLQVPPYPQVITAGNALVELNYIINQIRPGDPGKVYLAPFGRAILDSVVHAPTAQIPALAGALQRGAGEKHIVVNFHDAGLQALAESAGFTGRVPAPISDAVTVNDADLSANKADLVVGRSYSLAAQVGADGEVHDHLTLTYRNPVVTNPVKARLVRNVGAEYRDYIRVYVPETAHLDGMALVIDGKSSPVGPETIEWEFQRQSIAYWLVVPRGSTADLVLDYSGPFADASRSPERYALAWGKQVNALTWPIDVTVDMPGGRRHHFASDLEVDRSWEVSGG